MLKKAGHAGVRRARRSGFYCYGRRELILQSSTIQNANLEAHVDALLASQGTYERLGKEPNFDFYRYKNDTCEGATGIEYAPLRMFRRSTGAVFDTRGALLLILQVSFLHHSYYAIDTIILQVFCPPATTEHLPVSVIDLRLAAHRESRVPSRAGSVDCAEG